MAAVRRRLFLTCAVQQRAKRVQACRVCDQSVGKWAGGGHGRLQLQLHGMPGGVLRCAKWTDQVSGGRGGGAVALVSPRARRNGPLLSHSLRLGGLHRQAGVARDASNAGRHCSTCSTCGKTPHHELDWPARRLPSRQRTQTLDIVYPSDPAACPSVCHAGAC